MAVITPETDVILLKVPLEMDEKNQLTFADETAQYNYFHSLPQIAFDKFTYQRKDGTITVPWHADLLYGYNYVMYRNENFSNKWFYAYITGLKFLSPNSTAISIKTDVWQTWQFWLTYKPVFVEREHVNDDTIGAHTVPENIDVGEYVINDMRKIPMYSTGTASPDFEICFVVTKLPYDNAPWFNNPYENVGGVFTGQYMFAVHTFGAARNVIKVYEDRGQTTSEAIQNIYMIPTSCVIHDAGAYVTWSSSSVGQGVNIYQLNQAGWTSDKFTLEMPKTLNGYTPANNKMYTYPYNYFYIDNNAGTAAEYRWEDFPNSTSTVWSTPHPKVEYYKAMIPSTSISGKLFFENYKKYATSTGARTFNYGVTFGKVPVCAWTTDYYTNWLTQNGTNLVGNIVKSEVYGATAGLMSGNPAVALIGAGAGIVEGAISALGEIEKAKTTPPQAHGDVNCGDFSYAYDRCAMNFYMMCVRYEYAEICDKFMTMFGYKVNTVKVPNITGRANWNYVKTVGCYVRADIPQDDVLEIQGMFDKGVTFWHNPSTFGDYGQSNAIVS